MQNKNAKKNKSKHLDEKLEKEIDAYIDSLEIEENPNDLLGPKAKREKIRHEIKESVRPAELSHLLESAMEILISEGDRYLSLHENEKLLLDFTNATQYFTAIQPTDSQDKPLQEIIQISNDSMQSIVSIALAKYNETHYADSLALFSLLSILNPANQEYWFRLGIAAQECESYPLAIRAYNAALQLDSQMIGPRLFSAECLIALKHFDEAKQQINTAKKIAKETKVDHMWLEMIPSIERMIK